MGQDSSEKFSKDGQGEQKRWRRSWDVENMPSVSLWETSSVGSSLPSHQLPLLQSRHLHNCIELDELPADPVSVGTRPSTLGGRDHASPASF